MREEEKKKEEEKEDMLREKSNNLNLKGGDQRFSDWLFTCFHIKHIAEHMGGGINP